VSLLRSYPECGVNAFQVSEAGGGNIIQNPSDTDGTIIIATDMVPIESQVSFPIVVKFKTSTAELDVNFLITIGCLDITAMTVKYGMMKQGVTDPLVVYYEYDPDFPEKLFTILTSKANDEVDIIDGNDILNITTDSSFQGCANWRWEWFNGFDLTSPVNIPFFEVTGDRTAKLTQNVTTTSKRRQTTRVRITSTDDPSIQVVRIVEDVRCGTDLTVG
jgi:hypothetical protein